MQPTPQPSLASTENRGGGAEERSGAWDFFDRIYCISVSERGDRRELALREFADAGLLERLEFILVERHPDNPAQGIFESHLLCLNRGLEAGAQRILVFEDDVFFRCFDPQALRLACRELTAIEEWNGLFLGCLTSGSRRTGPGFLVRIDYRCLSHAYALNAPFARRIVREKWNGTPYDMLLRQRCAEYYALYPMCAFQGRSTSDNQTVTIDRLRRIFGGLPFIQRMNELYQNHKIPVLAAHLFILLGLAAMACTMW